MHTIDTAVDPRSAAFQANDEAQRALVADLRERLRAASLGGSEKSRERHVSRGKLLPRDRVDELLDDGSPFLEVAPLAANGLYNDEAPAAGVIAGIGLVHGRPVMVICNDATVKGGTYFPMTVKKHLRAQTIAKQNNLHCISLVDSGGAFLPMQDEVFPDRHHFGRIFFNQAQMSAAGIGQVIGHARARAVQLATAEFLGRDDLADRGLHERRAAEDDRALAADDHGLSLIAGT